MRYCMWEKENAAMRLLEEIWQWAVEVVNNIAYGQV